MTTTELTTPVKGRPRRVRRARPARSPRLARQSRPSRRPQPVQPVPRERVPVASRRFLAGASSGIFAALALGTIAYLLVGSGLVYARAQQLSFDAFRASLAAGTAPVAQAYVDEQTPAPDGAAPRSYLYPGGTPMALISIPALELENVVVGEGTSSGDLQAGPGHFRRSVFPGQAGTCLILGKRWTYGGPFKDIGFLQPDDRIQISTGQGVQEYAVTTVRRAGDQIATVLPGEGRLTLGTADGPPLSADGPLYVDARLITPARDSSGVRAVPADLQGRILTADGSWIAIMLWFQGLFVATMALVYAWGRWGHRQTWLVGTPVLLLLCLGLAQAVSTLLPNVL